MTTFFHTGKPVQYNSNGELKQQYITAHHMLNDMLMEVRPKDFNPSYLHHTIGLLRSKLRDMKIAWRYDFIIADFKNNCFNLYPSGLYGNTCWAIEYSEANSTYYIVEFTNANASIETYFNIDTYCLKLRCKNLSIDETIAIELALDDHA